MSATEFLDRLYAMGDADDPLLFVLDYLDTALCDGRFGDVDAVVRDADPGRLSTAQIVNLLCVSGCARDRLPARPAFVDRARAAVVERHPEEVDAIMQGLE